MYTFDGWKDRDQNKVKKNNSKYIKYVSWIFFDCFLSLSKVKVDHEFTSTHSIRLCKFSTKKIHYTFKKKWSEQRKLLNPTPFDRINYEHIYVNKFNVEHQFILLKSNVSHYLYNSFFSPAISLPDYLVLIRK